MKITLDLSKLLEDGKITQAEYEKFLALSQTGAASLAFNILIGFGIIAVAAGLIALMPNAGTGVAVGLAILGAGLAIPLMRATQWQLLSFICVLLGALMLGGGVVILTNASVAGFLLITTGFAVAGVAARSSLLVGLAVLALSSAIGARTDYMHASYFLGIEEPVVTVVLFGVLAIAAYLVSQRLAADYERLALMVSRTSVFLVNFGFWIGSLWGDQIGQTNVVISDVMFGVLWAATLIGSIIWAAKSGRQWVVNVMAVFAAIHFYTQWFERLGPEPQAILIAGVLALGFAVGLWHFNRHLWGNKSEARKS